MFIFDWQIHVKNLLKNKNDNFLSLSNKTQVWIMFDRFQKISFQYSLEGKQHTENPCVWVKIAQTEQFLPPRCLSGRRLDSGNNAHVPRREFPLEFHWYISR